MYIDIYLAFLLGLLFGACSYFSEKNGFKKGQLDVINRLCKSKIISITKQAEIIPYQEKHGQNNFFVDK